MAAATAEASAKFRVYSGFGKPPVPDAEEFAVQVVRMDRSFYVWVGPAQRGAQRMDNLSAALCKRARNSDKAADANSGAATEATFSMPSSATIFKGTTDDRSVHAEGIAQRLCKRLCLCAFILPALYSPTRKSPSSVCMFSPSLPSERQDGAVA